MCYKINTSCIKAIKSIYNAHKGSKATYMREMNELFAAELEVSQLETADIFGRGKHTTE